MSIVAIGINHKILRWARTSAGYSLDDAARKARISSQKLLEAEMGEGNISIVELRRIAHVYKRPVAIFYLNRVPNLPSI
ncbi:MAG: helix-turn-helix domain-containing protein, partial [Promethearchaeota archaeon]